ncbi:TIGR02444 family protein [Marinimicrobium alkaliphilum]|uniref:TIGR02444 family protein n=1 Tax=Marinimicrobium alkaliphilum TaxID=2202654 RepID=UPI000DBAC2FC|nr:TIGR02444 family protein [Marinimicrobium alkaliphilum]
MTRPASESTLWEFALWLYARPGISSLCIRVQDTYSVDVLQVLWLAWLDWRGQPQDAHARTEAEQLCARWQEQVVGPLRGVRRWLKVSPEDFPGHALEPFRSQVKALELEAERLLLQELQTLVEPAARQDSGSDYWRAGLRDYLMACGMPEVECEESLRRLLHWR